MAGGGRVVAEASGRTPSGAPMTVRVRSQARDQIGHWVAPPSMREHPCPHRCCNGARPHPRNLPVKLDRGYLRSLSEDELMREVEAYHRYADERTGGYLQVLAEVNRRDEAGNWNSSEQNAAARKERARDRRRRAGEEHSDEVYRQWLAAENATKGYMLNAAGKRADIDERTLFTGPESRVRKYASPELIEWFESHPRPTRETFTHSNSRRREALSRRRLG